MQICRAQFETKARTCTPPHQPSNGLFFFRAAATFRGILVSFMRICRARFETARAQTSADWAIKDTKIPSTPAKHLSKKEKARLPCFQRRRASARVTTSVRLYLTAQTSSGTSADIPYRCNRRTLSQPWHKTCASVRLSEAIFPLSLSVSSQPWETSLWTQNTGTLFVTVFSYVLC